MRPKKAARSSTKKGDQIITNVYLSESTYNELKKLSDTTGAPMAHYIREGVELVLDHYRHIFKRYVELRRRRAARENLK